MFYLSGNAFVHIRRGWLGLKNSPGFRSRVATNLQHVWHIVSYLLIYDKQLIIKINVFFNVH